jgi:hypothetical protein
MKKIRLRLIFGVIAIIALTGSLWMACDSGGDTGGGGDDSVLSGWNGGKRPSNGVSPTGPTGNTGGTQPSTEPATGPGGSGLVRFTVVSNGKAGVTTGALTLTFTRNPGNNLLPGDFTVEVTPNGGSAATTVPVTRVWKDNNTKMTLDLDDSVLIDGEVKVTIDNTAHPTFDDTPNSNSSASQIWVYKGGDSIPYTATAIAGTPTPQITLAFDAPVTTAFAWGKISFDDSKVTVTPSKLTFAPNKLTATVDVTVLPGASSTLDLTIAEGCTVIPTPVNVTGFTPLP